MTAAQRWIRAAKLWSVLSARMAMRLNSLQLAEEVLDKLTPCVEFAINLAGLTTLGMRRDDDGGAALIHRLDDPVGIERLVGDQGSEGDPLDEGRDPDRIVTLTRQQGEAHQIAQRIGQGHDLGGPAAPGLADGLAFSPPFAPCPWR